MFKVVEIPFGYAQGTFRLRQGTLAMRSLIERVLSAAEVTKGNLKTSSSRI
jgi:hypothetical protein